MFSRRPAGHHNRGRVGGAQLRAIWPPTEVAGLTGRWDMRTPAEYTVTGGTTVTSINNMASATAWAEATNPPGYDATALGGNPAMVFNGSSSRILSTEAAVLALFAGAAKAYTLFVVGQYDVAAVSAWFGAGDSAAAANNTVRCGSNSVPQGNFSKRGTAGTFVNGGTIAVGTPMVMVYRTDGTTASVWVNQAVIASGAFADNGAAPAPNRCAIGCLPTSAVGNFLNGKIGTLLIYSGALGDPDVRGLIAGLRREWSI
jgi:hypothetical protein